MKRVSKRMVPILLALAMILALSACGKSEAAQAVDDQIAAIGEVTLDSDAAITAAEEAVAGLSEEDQKSLDNKDMLEQARADYNNLVLDGQASEIEEAISAIGTVTLDSADAIATARSLYDSSEAGVQALVENIADLEAAEATLAELEVDEVTSLIDSLGTVTLNSASQIREARNILDSMSEENAAKVTNVSVLEAAEAQLKTLAQAQLTSLRTESDPVRGMSFYYPSVFPYYSTYWGTDIRTFVLPYIGQDSSSTWMRVVCDYTGDDWIFFEQLIFAVDDARYTKTYNYFDVTRDNGGGDVWEYVDFQVTDSDIDMLWEIANSTQTIVRFQGDDYHYDLTMSAADKQAIAQMLTIYEALA